MLAGPVRHRMLIAKRNDEAIDVDAHLPEGKREAAIELSRPAGAVRGAFEQHERRRVGTEERDRRRLSPIGRGLHVGHAVGMPFELRVVEIVGAAHPDHAADLLRVDAGPVEEAAVEREHRGRPRTHAAARERDAGRMLPAVSISAIAVAATAVAHARRFASALTWNEIAAVVMPRRWSDSPTSAAKGARSSGSLGSLPWMNTRSVSVFVTSAEGPM